MDSPPSSVERHKRFPDSPASVSPTHSDPTCRDTQELTSPAQSRGLPEEEDDPPRHAAPGEEDGSPSRAEQSSRRRWSFDDEDGDNTADPSSPSHGLVAAASAAKRVPRRQPPMNVETFYAAGEPGNPGPMEKDGFFDMYCRLNFMRVQERKFATVNHGASRNRQIAELQKEVKELKRALAEKRAKSAGAGRSASGAPGEPSLKAMVVELELKSKRLACLRAKRCRDLRLDLNLLLKSMGDQLSDFYPFNESLDRMAQRLDQFSWKAPAWIGYRPLLLQKHKAGGYQRWVDAGCPDPPHSVFQHKTAQTMEGVMRDDEAEDSAGFPSSSVPEKGASANSHSARSQDEEEFLPEAEGFRVEIKASDDVCIETSVNVAMYLLATADVPVDRPAPHADEGQYEENRRPEATVCGGPSPSKQTTSPAASDMSEDFLRVMEEKKRAAIAKREARLEEKRRMAAQQKQDAS
ncbi:hypothetical protein BESB_020190 [Besnoitia besnoiti]|uniref:Uncharacterized protein n=1 Tax=Besnoitia besnoiti TaxID=94643 RepID=A0A2A9M0F6_BESBE|nr:hypothetical protein BESB_020190 [Besnoitia besnoiti]PFH32078.1 hypothetical protein BESB_020190 [Besnoitia besnoiti]